VGGHFMTSSYTFALSEYLTHKLELYLDGLKEDSTALDTFKMEIANEFLRQAVEADKAFVRDIPF
jgi:hypothetical protein